MIRARLSQRRASAPVSLVGFGCGPRAQLMVSSDYGLQRETIQRAFEMGISFFDTSPIYGDGTSERNLGRALSDLGVGSEAVISTKLALSRDWTANEIQSSLQRSLDRLKRDRLDVVLLHNRVESSRGEVGLDGSVPGPPLLVEQLLGQVGVLHVLESARAAGIVGLIGLTTFGSEMGAVRTVLAESDVVDLVTVEHNLLTAYAGDTTFAPDAPWRRSTELIQFAHDCGLGVLGLRPLAGQLLTGVAADAGGPVDSSVPGSAAWSRRISDACAAAGCSVVEAAWRFAAASGPVASVLGGFRDISDMEQAVSGATGNAAIEAALRVIDADQTDIVR